MNITYCTPPGGPNKLIVNTGTESVPEITEYGADDFAAYAVLYPDRAEQDFAMFQAAPIQSLEDMRVAKLEALAHLRWEKEVAGIEVGGLQVKTDRESQSQLNSAFVSLKYGFITSTRWKGAGGWLNVTLAGIEPIATAVAQYVSACFANEEAHSNAIAALETVEALAAYDISTGWPGADVLT